jgi:hypothetical protein
MIYAFVLSLLTSTFNPSIDRPDSCTGNIVRDNKIMVAIHPSLPKYSIRLIDRETRCYKLIILDGNSRDTIQVIEDYHDGIDFPEEDSEDEKAVEFVDVNFDGYLDLKVLDNQGNTTNVSYKLWIFNPQRKVFEYDEQISELLGCNPSIDPSSKTFTTGGVLGCVGMCYSWNTYKFIDGKPVLIERESQDYQEDVKTKQSYFVRTLEMLVDGKLIETKRIKGTIEEIDKLWNK